MSKKIITIIVSFLLAFIVMSSGYSKWSKKLIIEGNVTVAPTTNTTTSAVVDLELDGVTDSDE